ncbi:MAG: GGDEF domain-containing protein [Thermomicrobiales bacterium]
MTTWILGLTFGATLTISAVFRQALAGPPLVSRQPACWRSEHWAGHRGDDCSQDFGLQSRADESQMDALTGLANRRGFDAGSLRKSLVPGGHALSLLMIDIDDFKQVNDRFGHGTGDESLRATARAIESSVRSIDIAARYGGEEFAVILPETTVVVAERIRVREQISTVLSEAAVARRC